MLTPSDELCDDNLFGFSVLKILPFENEVIKSFGVNDDMIIIGAVNGKQNKTYYYDFKKDIMHSWGET